ncbi:MAG: hypothetical protein HY075_02630, partial [Deltaproteobacteria bacterium]|nr:hypothetical protein [Deltaproteobacteria bacterium]
MRAVICLILIAVCFSSEVLARDEHITHTTNTAPDGKSKVERHFSKSGKMTDVSFYDYS